MYAQAATVRRTSPPRTMRWTRSQRALATRNSATSAPNRGRGRRPIPPLARVKRRPIPRPRAADAVHGSVSASSTQTVDRRRRRHGPPHRTSCDSRPGGAIRHTPVRFVARHALARSRRAPHGPQARRFGPGSHATPPSRRRRLSAPTCHLRGRTGRLCADGPGLSSTRCGEPAGARSARAPAAGRTDAAFGYSAPVKLKAAQK